MTIQDINAETRSLCDADSVSYPDATLLRRMNAALERVIGWIMGADGTWQFDDTNFTTLPVGTADLAVGQSNYTFNALFLDIETVKIKDLNGHWHIIDPLDQSETDIALEQYLVTNSFPQYYDKVGDTINLYPAPSASVVTLAAGMEVEFKRTAQLFTAADVASGVKVPGFASPCHIVLAYMAAIPYCMSYKKDRVALYEKTIGDALPPTGLKRDIIRFYAHREEDKRKIMSPKAINFR